MPILQMRKLRYGMGRERDTGRLKPQILASGCHLDSGFQPTPLHPWPPPPIPLAQARCSESQRVTLPFTSFLPVKGHFLP